MQKNSKDQKLFNVSSQNDDLDMKEGLMDLEYNILYLYLYKFYYWEPSQTSLFLFVIH